MRNVLIGILLAFPSMSFADEVRTDGSRIIENTANSGVTYLRNRTSGGVKRDIVSLTATTVQLGTTGTTTVTSKAPVTLMQKGSLAAPGIAFEGDADTGVFSGAGGSISLIGDGAYRLYTDASQFEPYGQLQAIDGTSALPGYSFNSDTNSGLYRVGEDDISLATGGAQGFVRISNSQVTLGASGGSQALITSTGVVVGGSVTASNSVQNSVIRINYGSATKGVGFYTIRMTGTGSASCDSSGCPSVDGTRGFHASSGKCLAAWTTSTGVSATCSEGEAPGDPYDRQCLCMGFSP